MSAARLCQIFALSLLGRQTDAHPDAEALMAAWTESAERLERVFLAYLRAQSDLPARLAELVVRYPQPVRVGSDRTVDALVVGIELVGETGELNAADLLELALTAPSSSTEDATWKRLVELAGSRYKNIVEPDSGLVVSTRSPSTLPTTPTASPSAVTPTRPRRSMSLDRPQLDQRGPSSRVGLAAINETSSAAAVRHERTSSTATEPDWASFASSGFDSTAPVPLTLDSFATAPRPAHANKLVRRRSSTSRRPLKPVATTDVFAASKQPPTAKVVSVEKKRIDPAFAELYLDALGDKVATRSWPSFVIVELQKLEGVEVKLLLVERRIASVKAAVVEQEDAVVKPKVARSASSTSALSPPASPPRADRCVACCQAH